MDLRSEFSTGEVINLMSTDADRVVGFCPSFHQFWSLPIQVCLWLLVDLKIKSLNALICDPGMCCPLPALPAGGIGIPLRCGVCSPVDTCQQVDCHQDWSVE